MGTQNETIRVGVVGVGYWGSKHARVLRSTMGVASVIEIDPRLAASPGRQNGGASGYTRMDDALSEVDALVIATPPSSHARLGIRAIEAGKHVLIEKPLATTTAEARSMVEAAKRADVVLMPGHTLEHNAAVHKLRELVQGGELGQLFYLDCARLNLGLYQPDVGVIMDLAPHDVSIANFVLGSQPTVVTAWGARHVHPEHEDVARILLDYADIGVRANIHVSWLSPLKVRKVTAVGSRKMATFDDLGNDEERVRLFDKAALPPEAGDGPLSRVAYHLGDVILPFVPFAEPLAVQDQHFIDSILRKSAPAVDGSSGLAVVRVLECAEVSLREQRPVQLAEVERRPKTAASSRYVGMRPGAASR